MLAILLLLLLAHVPRSYTEPLPTEVHRRLLSAASDPLSSTDIWSSFPASHRVAWTQANPQIPTNLTSLPPLLQNLRTTPIRVPISLFLIAPSTYPLAPLHHLLPATTATSPGIALTFTIAPAPPTLHARLSHLDPSKPLPASLFLSAAATRPALNTLFLRLSTSPSPPPHPHLFSARVASLTLPLSLPPASLLARVERAAIQVFAPAPAPPAFPLPFLRRFRVEVYAYTPGYPRRAPWVPAFRWTDFEQRTRQLALRGVKVSFYSAQTNADCPRCLSAFANATLRDSRFPAPAARVLGFGDGPARGWEEGVVRVYVVDVGRVSKTAALGAWARAGRTRVWTYPGAAVVAVRTRVGEGGVDGMERVLAEAAAGAMYGLEDVAWYGAAGRADGRDRPATVLFDVVARLTVASCAERWVRDVAAVVEGAERAKVDLRKAVGGERYGRVVERVNLLVWRVREARRLAGEGELAGAVAVIAGGEHDVKAVREIVGVREGEWGEHAVRCRFSRLRRGAERASEVVLGGRAVAAAGASAVFVVSAGTVYAGMAIWAGRKVAGKRE